MCPARIHGVHARTPAVRPPRKWQVLIALIIVAVVGAGWSIRSWGMTPASTASSLPWPEDGQSTVEVEGLGSLGTKGEQKPVPIASVAKVMTAYVILSEHPLSGAESGPAIDVDQKAADESLSSDESTVPVSGGRRLTERQLLELMLIPSGNNIARLLARWDAGTEKAFVSKMNGVAAGLGMTRTTYTSASGVDPSTKSTAVDQLKLARSVMRDEVFRSIVAMPSVAVPEVPGPLANVNTLLGRFGVIGIKTGSSTPAGGALMWAANAQAGGTKRLILGVVLHQNADTTPDAGLYAALDSTQKLIIGVEKALASNPGRPDASAAPGRTG
jgi:serine-type D-Ala-D-Ala carboxypeptidase (penicillin-binding protein 5/6)